MPGAVASVTEAALEAVVADIDGDLRFLSELIIRMRRRTAQVDLGALERAIGAVQARRRDPSLYLALVGEFSSGKTSFTNVLLGERLLKTSPLANTAAVTAIRQGHRRALTARFRGDPSDLAFPSRQIDARLAEFNRRAETLEEVLGILTADEDVAPAVERVTVEHPSPLLGDNIVLLDTPGINSADDAHTVAALEAITRDADAFVVLVPSNAPVSMRLQALLRDHLKLYLHRTTFVVTRMTQIEEDERNSVLRFIDRRLRHELGIDAPLVAASSLGAAMRARVSDGRATPQDHEWLRAFEALRADLVERLRQERTVTIAERVIVLLREAMQLLESSLHGEAAELETRAEVLERNAPADLHRFCATEARGLRASAEVAAADARRRVAAAIEAGEQAAGQEIAVTIDQAATVQSLDGVLDEAPVMVERHIAAVAADVGSTINELCGLIHALERSFGVRFEQQFHGLDRLTGNAFRPRSYATPESSLTLAEVSADAKALKTRLNRRGKWAAAGGAGFGAIIGTVIAPGLGTLIGAGLGGVFGGGDDTSLTDRRNMYWTELEPEVRAVFHDLRRQYDSVLDGQTNAATVHLEDCVDRYRRSYAQAIRHLEADHANAQRELQGELAQGRRDAADVGARITLLRQRADTLAAVARARRTRV